MIQDPAPKYPFLAEKKKPKKDKAEQPKKEVKKEEVKPKEENNAKVEAVTADEAKT